MLPSSEKLLGSNFIFQDDNARCHESKKVNEWFQQRNINTLQWPSQSPDLNPIENLWAVFKKKIVKKMVKKKMN